MPEQGIWEWTESHLLSLFYFGLCADFRDSDLLSLSEWFLRRHSREYPLLSGRFYDLVAHAQSYVEISGQRTRDNIRAKRERKASGRRKTRKDKGTGVRTREVAELLASAWTVAEIARHLGLHHSTVQEQVRLIKHCGGIHQLFPDLRQPFTVPLSRELFEATRGHKHRLTALQAGAVMEDVARFAKRVEEPGFLTLSRLKRALRTRENDSRDAITQVLKNAIAKRVLRQGSSAAGP